MGVEMALLRMLAFRPVDEGIQRPAPTGAREAAIPVRREAGPNSKGRDEERSQAGPAVVGTHEERAAYTGQTERSGAQQPAHTAVAPAPAPASVSSDDEWSSVIQVLGLTGLSQMVASHCVLKSRTDKELVLVLDNAHAHLLNPSLQQRLEERIQAHFGAPLKLVIHAGVTPTETPASRQKRETDERMRRAEASILADQGVRSLQEAFNAQVVDESIQPLDRT